MQYGEGYDREAQIAPGAQNSPNLDLGLGRAISEVEEQGNSPEESVIQAENPRMSESYREDGAFCIRRLNHTLEQGRAKKQNELVGRS